MIGPDLLRSGGGKTDVVADGALIPRLAHAEAAHVAHLHVHHHLRRRHHYGAHIFKWIDARVRQPVIEPHGVGAGREGVREGERAFRLAADQLLQAGSISDLLLF